MADTDTDQQSAIAKKLSEYLEGAFEAVALTRRAHFEKNPGTRPTRAQVDEIITTYARQNAVIAGACNLVPGPFGMLTIVPEMTMVIRNQIQMIYDLGVAHGKEAHLDARLLLAIFGTVLGGGALGLAAVKGGQLVVKRAALRVIQRVIVWLGGKITQRVLKQLLSRYVPFVGAAAMAVWAHRTTRSMGLEAAELLAKEIVDEEESADAC